MHQPRAISTRLNSARQAESIGTFSDGVHQGQGATPVGMLFAAVLAAWFIGGYALLALGLGEYVAVVRAGIVLLAVLLIRKPKHESVSSVYAARVYALIVFSLLGIAIISAVSAHDPVFSVLRALLCMAVLIASYRAIEVLVAWSILDDWRWTGVFNGLLLLFLIAMLAGGAVLPQWREGISGTRLSGGTNPNSVALYAYLILLWVYLTADLREHKGFFDGWTKVASWLVILWSGSRGALIAAVVFISLHICVSLIFKRGRSPMPWSYTSLLCAIILGLVGVGIMAAGLSDRAWQFVQPAWDAHIDRMSLGEDENVLSRLETWSILQNEWRRNPILGSLGWYYTSRQLDAFGFGETVSSHNFYLRTLAEVGLLGLMCALLLPVFALIVGARLLLFSFSSFGRRSESNLVAASVGVATVSLFLREFGEDSYLTEFISPVTGWVFLGIAILGACSGRSTRVP
jgi:hypothetical protein